jgi:uncharacterized phage protein gp47/JayE
MAYFKPYIDATGFHYPTFPDIRDDLITVYQNIYGADIYLENDSQDRQFISAVALMIYDDYQAREVVYNNRSPQSAIGAGLDGLLKLNGLERLVSSYSTCQVILSGTVGKIITDGVVKDISGNKWSLPASCTIGEDGTVEVSAVCQTIGAITAQPGDINIIETPTSGWTAVANEVAAVPGQPVETDPEAKSRQALSVMIPGHGPLEGMVGALLRVANIRRVKAYENVTNLTDANGFPPHSFAVIAEGGTNQDVADAIYYHLGYGRPLGDTAVVYEDDYGDTTTIRFYRPENQAIDVTVTLHRMTGYTSAIADAIQEAIYDFLNGFNMGIGQVLTASSLYGVVLSIIPNLANPLFAIRGLTFGLHGESQSDTDIILEFNQAAVTDLTDIVILEV